MLLNNYIAVSTKHFVNSEGNQIFTESGLSRPYNIGVPWYLNGRLDNLSKISGFSFNLSEGDAIKLQSIAKNPVPSLELNDLVILYNGDIEVVVNDRRSGKKQSFVFSRPLYYSQDKIRVEWTHSSNKFKYNITNLGVVTHAGVYSDRDCDTGTKTPIHYGVGLTNRQFTIYFRDTILDGTCYVLLLGHVAVLLRDDLSPDAIVIADSYNAARTNPYLIFSRLVWSSNPYILYLCMTYGGEV